MEEKLSNREIEFRKKINRITELGGPMKVKEMSKSSPECKKLYAFVLRTRTEYIKFKESDEKILPSDPKEYYSDRGEWKGWRDFLGTNDICDDCGKKICECDKEIPQ